MASFETGEIPHDFAFNETGGLIHYKHTIVVATPPPNAGPWGDAWLSFGTAWADAKVGVSIYSGTTWGGVKIWDVKDGGPRTAEKLPAGTQKIAIGRARKSASDMVDNTPIGWLLEFLG